jgi:hypothetical protein
MTYTLTNNPNTLPLDSSIFSISGGFVKVSTSDVTKVGVYLLTLKGDISTYQTLSFNF